MYNKLLVALAILASASFAKASSEANLKEVKIEITK